LLAGHADRGTNHDGDGHPDNAPDDAADRDYNHDDDGRPDNAADTGTNHAAD